MTRRRKAIFLDRDGTINVDTGYLSRVSDFTYLPNAKEGLRDLQSAGYRLIVITNQSGIARGFFTEEDYEGLTGWMVADLALSGIEIADVYHCPHHPAYSGECDCRKPKLGMYRWAVSDHSLDLAESWVIGDKLRDLSPCLAGLCRGILISENQDAVATGEFDIASDLLDAAMMVRRSA